MSAHLCDNAQLMRKVENLLGVLIECKTILLFSICQPNAELKCYVSMITCQSPIRLHV